MDCTLERSFPRKSTSVLNEQPQISVAMLHLINCIALALFAVSIANSYPNYTYTDYTYTDYKQGWKNAYCCEFDRVNINCTGGTVIQIKTAWFGKTVPHRKGCSGESQSMPDGGCSTNEPNIRLFIDECHGKLACSVNGGNVRPNPCGGYYKWSEVWYECVPGIELMVTKPSTKKPNYPVLGGFDENGRDLFVGRAFYRNDFLPCYVTPESNCVFGSDDVTNGNSTFEYLVGGVVNAGETKYSWLRNHRGEVPPSAVCLGQTKDGAPLFVGRAELRNGLYIGKVVPKEGLYIGLGGSLFFPDYEILVQ
ncbi:hypothetical protein GE061_005004 [Apolygus lucorum]|uniref:SUEL-type lectin domain-containing protein n=1 Tax=Apolygus lucorum TaxID=248454 RepID=A0A8S9WWS5_APOLU|nr:hypothetical protein GE061_005004 [Apolygus lucorum]